MSKENPQHAKEDDDSVIVKRFANKTYTRSKNSFNQFKKIQKQKIYILKVSNASRTEDTYHKVQEVRKKEIKQE